MIEQDKYIAVLEVANKRFEENEKLREKVDIWHRAAQKNYDDKEDLKERIAKAIELVESIRPVTDGCNKPLKYKILETLRGEEND